MTTTKKATLLISILLISIALATPLTAKEHAETNSRFARIILFVPDGSEAPPAYEAKLRSIAARTESFFATGIEKWGWKVERREIFARNEAGEIEIILARGALPKSATGHDALPVITKNALAAATKKIGEGPAKQSVWWTFYHCPDHTVKGFRGMGGRDGGRSINAYPAAEGEITPNIDLGCKEMWPLNLKGCIHEFGHALGLPHIGPKPSENLGNTLMGPINKAFVAKSTGKKDDPRVYLCEASAAMLAKHPLFASNPQDIEASPNAIKVSDLSFQETPKNEFKVTGTVTSKAKIHSVIILDSSRGFGDYWTRSYRAKVSENGEFALSVNDPFGSPRGSLTLYFCLEDGRNSATGKREVLQRDITEIRYEGNPGERKFTRQTSNNRTRSRRD